MYIYGPHNRSKGCAKIPEPNSTNQIAARIFRTWWRFGFARFHIHFSQLWIHFEGLMHESTFAFANFTSCADSSQSDSEMTHQVTKMKCRQCQWSPFCTQSMASAWRWALHSSPLSTNHNVICIQTSLLDEFTESRAEKSLSELYKLSWNRFNLFKPLHRSTIGNQVYSQSLSFTSTTNSDWTFKLSKNFK
jgi:hypothetical protein